MFGVSIPEVFIILVIALIVIGPEKLPKIAGTIGKVMAEFRGVVNNVKRGIEEEEVKLGAAAKDAKVDESPSRPEETTGKDDDRKNDQTA